MKILSLFDGISCGRVALDRAGIKVDKYYASEIKEDAIKVSKYNYPDIIQVGDITKLKGEDFKDIDLIIGGSPCQSFSNAGNKEGFEGKSGLFYEYLRMLKEIKPKYFLLENVRMKKEWQNKITKLLREIYPETEVYNINSKLVSAQLRNRFYWTNIPNIKQPEDKGIMLKDILESGYTDREKARAILESESRPLKDKERMCRRYYKTRFTTVIFKDKELSDYAKKRIKERLGDKIGIGYNWFNDTIKNEKSGTLLNNDGWSGKGTTLVIKDNDIRYLTQTELERLQTLPDGFTKCLTRNKAAGCIGDGWTVDVITHIFNNLK